MTNRSLGEKFGNQRTSVLWRDGLRANHLPKMAYGRENQYRTLGTCSGTFGTQVFSALS